MPKQAKTLDDALATYDRQSNLETVNKAESKRLQVFEHFPLEGWPTMPL